MQLHSYRGTKDIYRHLASYKPASLSLSSQSDIYDIKHTYIHTTVITHCTPSLPEVWLSDILQSLLLPSRQVAGHQADGLLQNAGFFFWVHLLRSGTGSSQSLSTMRAKLINNCFENGIFIRDGSDYFAEEKGKGKHYACTLILNR